MANQVCQWLREKRKERGLKQCFVAEKMGISGPNLSQLESGRNTPRFQTVCRFLETLNCSPSEKLELIEIGNRQKSKAGKKG